MKCHYEILEVERTANEDEIKKSYRKLALQWHPDKNPDNVEECTKQFAIIQQAYDVLMDPQERAWYDRHRDQILKGGLDEHYEDNSINLFAYFSSTCYVGYSDDEKGFYTVYRNLFNTIIAEDSEFMDDQEKVHKVPGFGESSSSYDEVVGPFYGYWQSYCTAKSYAWLDKYDIRQAPNRQILRAMEKENKKIKDMAKKERNEEIRTLVAFVRKRDKRVQLYRKILDEQRAEQMKKVEAQRTAQKLQNLKAASEYKEASWHDTTNREEELKTIEMQHDLDFFGSSDKNENQNEENEDEENDYSDEEDEEDNFYCAACEKAFKTPKAYENHERSKKHKDNVLTLKTHMAEDELNLLGLADKSASDTATFGGSASKKGGKKAKHKESKESDEQQKEADEEKSPTGPHLQRRVSEDVSQVGQKIERIRERRESSGCAGETPALCATCHEIFSSRNKLFAHIKETNHGTLKNVPAADSTKKTKKKKK